jgi:hypothetical protein
MWLTALALVSCAHHRADRADRADRQSRLIRELARANGVIVESAGPTRYQVQFTVASPQDQTIRIRVSSPGQQLAMCTIRLSQGPDVTMRLPGRAYEDGHIEGVVDGVALRRELGEPRLVVTVCSDEIEIPMAVRAQLRQLGVYREVPAQ